MATANLITIKVKALGQTETLRETPDMTVRAISEKLGLDDAYEVQANVNGGTPVEAGPEDTMKGLLEKAGGAGELTISFLARRSTKATA